MKKATRRNPRRRRSPSEKKIPKHLSIPSPPKKRSKKLKDWKEFATRELLENQKSKIDILKLLNHLETEAGFPSVELNVDVDSDFLADFLFAEAKLIVDIEKRYLTKDSKKKYKSHLNALKDRGYEVLSFTQSQIESNHEDITRKLCDKLGIKISKEIKRPTSESKEFHTTKSLNRSRASQLPPPAEPTPASTEALLEKDEINVSREILYILTIINEVENLLITKIELLLFRKEGEDIPDKYFKDFKNLKDLPYFDINESDLPVNAKYLCQLLKEGKYLEGKVELKLTENGKHALKMRYQFFYQKEESKLKSIDTGKSTNTKKSTPKCVTTDSIVDTEEKSVESARVKKDHVSTNTISSVEVLTPLERISEEVCKLKKRPSTYSADQQRQGIDNDFDMWTKELLHLLSKAVSILGGYDNLTKREWDEVADIFGRTVDAVKIQAERFK